ncbi:hypothetical protein [Ciceribacter sp. RN22]|uniref:hypothetical protein n=1 Tax=Ciceribacter sp. RN22 TaxID=2954932 RepID=UPI002092AA0E|nr:hypothetical protein [Ciceribacter sp. RN22]MCO6180791.1 hypothetical protein [Ciceribacter sp. RN22]
MTGETGPSAPATHARTDPSLSTCLKQHAHNEEAEPPGRLAMYGLVDRHRQQRNDKEGKQYEPHHGLLALNLWLHIDLAGMNAVGMARLAGVQFH